MAQEQTLTERTKFGGELTPYISRLLHLSITRSGKSEVAEVVRYLSRLYVSGEITEKGFESLVKYYCQIFVEAEVERKFSAYLEQKLLKLLSRLASDDAVLEILGASTEEDE